MLKERKQDQLESLTVDTSDEWRAENAGGWSSDEMLDYWSRFHESVGYDFPTRQRGGPIVGG